LPPISKKFNLPKRDKITNRNNEARCLLLREVCKSFEAYRFGCAAAQNTDKFNSIPALLLINEILINVADLRRVCVPVLSLLFWSPAPKYTLRRRFYLNTTPQRRN
jgi:hypothetical protein